MKAYIIWETKENRPLIARADFGATLVFLAKENAQAYIKDLRILNDITDTRDMPEIKEADIYFN
jgi:hypothetical protein